MPIIETPTIEGANVGRKKTVRGDYSFAVDGGAISTIALTSGTPIPAGAIIVGGLVEITTQLTSGGAATIALQVESAGDICAATPVASWTAGRMNVLPAQASGSLTSSTTVKTTAARNISAVIAAAALTAGVFKVVLEYIEAP